MTYDRDFSRREMLKMLSLAGSAGLLAACAKAADRSASGDSGTAVASDKDEKLETTSIRLVMDPRFTVLCYAPQYLADKYLKEEGFTNVEYVSKIDGSEAQALLHGDADISSALAVDWIMPISRGEPVVILGGLHPGCVEIFANKSIATMKDLKGKRIGVSGLQSPERFLLASIVSYIGLDPEKDIEWVFAEPLQWGPMLVDGKVDALAAFPPMNQGCTRRRSGRCSSTRSPTTPGRTTSAACWQRTAATSRRIPWRRSARSARSCGPPSWQANSRTSPRSAWPTCTSPRMRRRPITS
jgi:ABC-type nitrate/sulfonate/bicarbonate transport system substrate-binding protein